MPPVPSRQPPTSLRLLHSHPPLLVDGPTILIISSVACWRSGTPSSIIGDEPDGRDDFIVLACVGLYKFRLLASEYRMLRLAYTVAKEENCWGGLFTSTPFSTIAMTLGLRGYGHVSLDTATAESGRFRIASVPKWTFILLELYRQKIHEKIEYLTAQWKRRGKCSNLESQKQYMESVQIWVDEAGKDKDCTLSRWAPSAFCSFFSDVVQKVFSNASLNIMFAAFTILEMYDIQ